MVRVRRFFSNTSTIRRAICNLRRGLLVIFFFYFELIELREENDKNALFFIAKRPGASVGIT